MSENDCWIEVQKARNSMVMEMVQHVKNANEKE